MYRYKREFGFTIEARAIVIDDIIVRGTAKSRVPSIKELDKGTGVPLIEKVSHFCTLLM